MRDKANQAQERTMRLTVREATAYSLVLGTIAIALLAVTAWRMYSDTLDWGTTAAFLACLFFAKHALIMLRSAVRLRRTEHLDNIALGKPGSDA